MKIYHIGLLKDYRHKDTVIIQARQNKDCLNCELWRYMGTFETTKKLLKSIKSQLLDQINATYNTNYTRIRID